MITEYLTEPVMTGGVIRVLEGRTIFFGASGIIHANYRCTARTKLLYHERDNTKSSFVHKPSQSLINASINSKVQTWFVEDIARLVVNYDLVDWLIAKAK